MTFDAFICCTAAEQAEANVIRAALEGNGIRCAIAPRDIRPGHQPVMILLLSRQTSGSVMIETEVGRAVYRGFPLIVVRLDSAPPGKRLAYYLTSRPFHRIDAVTPPLSQHLPALLHHVATILGVALPRPLADDRAAPALGPPAERRAPQDDPGSRPRKTQGGRRERVGFISYTDEDDEASEGSLQSLRARIHSELQLQFGCEVRLWQNKHTILSGAHWRSEVENAIAETDFFIAILTPVALASELCDFELSQFLAREAVLGRTDLVFPLLWITVPDLGGTAANDDNRPHLLADRRFTNWRALRHVVSTEPEVAADPTRPPRCTANDLLRLASDSRAVVFFGKDNGPGSYASDLATQLVNHPNLLWLQP